MWCLCNGLTHMKAVILIGLIVLTRVRVDCNNVLRSHLVFSVRWLCMFVSLFLFAHLLLICILWVKSAFDRSHNYTHWSNCTPIHKTQMEFEIVLWPKSSMFTRKLFSSNGDLRRLRVPVFFCPPSLCCCCLLLLQHKTNITYGKLKFSFFCFIIRVVGSFFLFVSSSFICRGYIYIYIFTILAYSARRATVNGFNLQHTTATNLMK